MTVKYIGDYYKVTLIKEKVYKVLFIENGWYELNTEVGETAFFAPEQFEIIEPS